MPQSTIFSVRKASGVQHAFGNRRIFCVKLLRPCSGIKAAHPLLISTLLLFGLSGCRSTYDAQAAFVASDSYKGIHPVKVGTMGGTPGVSSEVDITTGRPFAQPPHPSPGIDKVATPNVSSTKITLDNPSGINEEGERTKSWTGIYAIYWKLNWVRQELLNSNVPKDMPDVVVRAREHSQRIAHEGLHAPRDGALKLSSSLTVEQCLEPADAALQYLATGLTHMDACTVLDTASIPYRTLPWNADVTEMQSALERIGLLPAKEKTSSRFKSQLSDDDDTSSSSIIRHVPSRAYISTGKQTAATLIMSYAAKYHASPEVCAQKEFEKALQETLKLRDLLELRYITPSVPGDSTIILGSLHQERGGMLARPNHYLPAATDISASLPDTAP